MSWNKAKFISTEASLQPFHQTLIIGNAESHNFCYAIFGIPGPFFMLKSACWRPFSADFANIFRSDGHLLYTQEPAVHYLLLLFLSRIIIFFYVYFFKCLHWDVKDPIGSALNSPLAVQHVPDSLWISISMSESKHKKVSGSTLFPRCHRHDSI